MDLNAEGANQTIKDLNKCLPLKYEFLQLVSAPLRFFAFTPDFLRSPLFIFRDIATGEQLKRHKNVRKEFMARLLRTQIRSGGDGSPRNIFGLST